MQFTALILCLLLAGVPTPDKLEKEQKKELEAQAKTILAEAQHLEKTGNLAAARSKYAESQSLLETHDSTDAIKRLDDEIRKRVKNSLNDSRKLYEQHKYKESAALLDEAMKLESLQSVISYNLALCYYQIGERTKSLEYLNKAKFGTNDPKQKQKLQQLATFISTGENASGIKDADRDHITHVNLLTESIGLESSLADAAGGEDSILSADSADDPAPPLPPSATKTPVAPAAHSNINATRRSSLCNALGDLKNPLSTSAAATFNLANCAESNGRASEAAKLLEKYLELAPTALDAPQALVRIADLKSLVALPGQKGIEVRKLYASVYSALAERKYDRALADLTKASTVDPDFPLTKWRLALLYEAMGDVDQARANFLRYQELSTDPSAKDEATLHLSTLDAKRSKYDEEIDASADIISELFNRSMNLTFNGLEDRSAIRAKRANVAKKDKNKSRNRVGGFAIPYAYAQQQLVRASEHLQIALALFPLGAEANELMALVFLQANDGRAATKSFDVVASQNLPVSFYAELRGRKQDQAVKCELTHDHLRFIYLSSYDRGGKVAPPSKPAGDDGLGDLVIEPSLDRKKSFDSLDLSLAEIKKIETNNGLLRLKLEKQELSLAPIYLPAVTPIEGPPARRFANNYTRLFVRYPGLEDSKLGTEGMTGGEKFVMGYKLATSGIDMAMGGFTGIGAIGAAMDAISITRTIHGAMNSLSVSFSTWEKSVDDQQQLLAGKSFKAIPTQPASLVFLQELK